MNQYNQSQSGFSPLTRSNHQRQISNPWANDTPLSPQSSTCVRSSSSQDPMFTRGELVDIMKHISAFARLYGAAYHGIGSSYHALPYSARSSAWIIPDMRDQATEALTASYSKPLPDLVSIFSEVSLRLGEAVRLLLCAGQYEWQASERQLRRCDMLLKEAEIRLRFLQVAVWNMWFAVKWDVGVNWDEGELLTERRVALEKLWQSVLPQICFTEPEVSRAQRQHQE